MGSLGGSVVQADLFIKWVKFGWFLKVALLSKPTGFFFHVSVRVSQVWC